MVRVEQQNDALTQFFLNNGYYRPKSPHDYRLYDNRIDFFHSILVDNVYPRLHCLFPLDQVGAPIFEKMDIHLDQRSHKGSHFTRNGRELVSKEIMQLKDSLQDPDSIPAPHRQLLIGRLNHLAVFGASEIIAQFADRSKKPGRRDSKHRKYIRRKNMWMGSVYTWEVD